VNGKNIGLIVFVCTASAFLALPLLSRRAAPTWLLGAARGTAVGGAVFLVGCFLAVHGGYGGKFFFDLGGFLGFITGTWVLLAHIDGR
jgi:hypothetical protein